MWPKATTKAQDRQRLGHKWKVSPAFFNLCPTTDPDEASHRQSRHGLHGSINDAKINHGSLKMFDTHTKRQRLLPSYLPIGVDRA